MENLVNKLNQLIEAPDWTEEDRRWLLQYLQTSDADELKTLLLQKLQESKDNQQQMAPGLSEKMLDTIHEGIGMPASSGKAPVHRMYTRRIAAALVIGVLATGAYLFLRTTDKMEVITTKTKTPAPGKHDALPGKDKAILTLDDGTTLSLDDAQNGILTQQGSTKVLKLNGRLSYNASPSGAGSATIAYNTIATPRGGQYQIVLPDGSQVWLNAASSLRFPTAFSGKERRVEVTGEAYFEIAKNAAMPFTVALPSVAGGSEIQVLGTHFNVSAYHDDALLKTTLLEGAVTFVNGSRSTLLKPGQQSQLTKNGQLDVASQVDVAGVMAWKNGVFHFEGADIEMVMKQLSRWYDVDIVYGDKKVNDLFYAEIPRNTRLSDALKALALTGKVDFKIIDKKIIVNM